VAPRRPRCVGKDFRWPRETKGSLRLYFGLTEDGIHGPWIELVKLKEKKDLGNQGKIDSSPGISSNALGLPPGTFFLNPIGCYATVGPRRTIGIDDALAKE